MSEEVAYTPRMKRLAEARNIMEAEMMCLQTDVRYMSYQTVRAQGRDDDLVNLSLEHLNDLQRAEENLRVAVSRCETAIAIHRGILKRCFETLDKEREKRDQGNQTQAAEV